MSTPSRFNRAAAFTMALVLDISIELMRSLKTSNGAFAKTIPPKSVS
jgi:hypothetical protein